MWSVANKECHLAAIVLLVFWYPFFCVKYPELIRRSGTEHMHAIYELPISRWVAVTSPKYSAKVFFLLRGCRPVDMPHVHNYRHTCDIRRTWLGNDIFDHTDVVGASPVGFAATTSSFSTSHLAPMVWAKNIAWREEKHFSDGIWCNWP